MARVLYHLNNEISLSDGDGAGQYSYSTEERISVATTHQLSMIPATGATGTVKIIFVPYGIDPTSDGAVQVLLDSSGTEIEVDLSGGSQSFTFDAAICAFGIIATSNVSGGVGAYLAGW